MNSPTPTPVRVPLNDFPSQWREIESDALAAVRRVGASGWYVLGEEVRTFERDLGAFWGLGFAVGVASGLDAIEIGLRCLGVAPGDRVLTTPLSAFATTLAILRSRARPVFVDVDVSGNLDLGLAREALDGFVRAGTPIRFLVPVHLYGNPLDLGELSALRDDYELRVVEDCAQAIGARWADRPVGSSGQVAATSFYPTKNLGALGDGGAILTADSELAGTARAIRHYGQTGRYLHELVGMNSRLDEIHAAVLREAMLPRLDAWTEARRGIAARYLDGIRNPRIALPRSSIAAEPVWHLFPVLADPGMRASLAAHLGERGIQTGEHYPRLITDQPALQLSGGGETVGEFTNAARFARDEVSLPIHPGLTDEQVSAVIEAANEWEPPR